MVRQAYDGASLGRRTDGWTSGGTSANAEIQGSLPRLLARSRDLVRNDPTIRNAKRVVTLYSVGTGIELQLDSPEWQALWDRWIRRAEAAGLLDFYGLQALAAGTIFESGAVLLRRRMRRASDGLEVPVQVEALEPDFLDTSRDGTLGNGGWVQGGIQFTPFGQREGYWLHTVHPGEVGSSFWARGDRNESRFVPASEILHAFEVERPGQVVGVPHTASVLLRARDLHDYEEAELVRKKIEACSVATVTQAGGMFGSPLGPTPSGASATQDPRPEAFEPGMFHYMPPGASVEFNDPKGNTAFPSYMKTARETIGAGLGVPYDKLTGDLSQANYSSLKAGGNTFEASMDALRWLVLIPRVCDPVLEWFYQAAEVAGVAPARRPEHEWQPPPYPEVDPYKEATARVLDIRSGVTTPQSVIRSRGGDPVRQLDEFKRWNELLDEREIVLDTDPRKVNRSGVVQSRDPLEDGGNTNE